MTDYITEVKNRRQEKQLKDSCFFGELAGILLLCYGFMGYLENAATWDYFFLAVMLCGGIFFLLGVIFPEALQKPCKGFTWLGNLIGKVLFTVLLSIVYLVMILPFYSTWKKKRVEYGFIFSEEMESGKEMGGFQPWEYETSKSVGGPLRLLGYFVQRKEYVLLPIVIILVCIGIVLFFVSSTVVAPFIYTLF